MSGKTKEVNGVAVRVVLWIIGLVFVAGGVFATVKISAGTLVEHEERITQNTSSISTLELTHAQDVGDINTKVEKISVKQDMMHDDIKWIKDNLK